MAKEITLAYNPTQRVGTITFPNGRTLSIQNVSEQQATDFAERHGPEFEKRDCYFHLDGGVFERSDSNG